MPTEESSPGGLRDYQLPRSVFEEICSGAITEKSMRYLRMGQYSRRRLLLRALLDVARMDTSLQGPLRDPEHAWDVLSEAEKRNPEVAEEILMYPPVGVWATRVLRRAQQPFTDDTPIWVEFGYLHGMAAAAALRAGVTCELQVPICYGAVTLPTVGQVQFQKHETRLAEVHSGPFGAYARTEDEVVDITHGQPRSNRGWYPAVKHRSGSNGSFLEVWLDDVNPYREFAEPKPPHRLSNGELAEWKVSLDGAWKILDLRHEDYARELAAGLSTLVPISSASGVHGASSSAAFGGVVVSLKDSATALAETLVHELQHSKLNALLDLVPLQRGDVDRYFYAPWRVDPRPLSGLLHGMYAFLAVIEFWRVQRAVLSGTDLHRAHFVFAHRRHQVRDAVNAARSIPELTELGRQFVAALATRLSVCEDETIPLDVLHAVRKIADDHRATWRMRHLRPDAEYVESLARAWLASEPLPQLSALEPALVPDQRPSKPLDRSELLMLRTAEPDRFAERAWQPDIAPGDLAYALGDYGTSTAAYLSAIRRDPCEVLAWAGLGLSLQARGHRTAARALLDTPETVCSIHRHVLELRESAADPVGIAAWIGAGIGG